MDTKLHIVIVGAGLSGLAAAIGLGRAGHHVTVLERAPEMREIGAGIQIPVNSARALKLLGVLDKIAAHAVQPHETSLRSYKDGSPLSTLNLNPYTQKTYGLPVLVVHRADFCRVLYEEARSYSVTVRFGCTVVSIDFSTPAVHLTSGETVTASVIIGADGERSVCREALLQRPDPPQPSGRLVYRILIDAAEMRQYPELSNLISPPSVDVWAGPKAHIVCYLLEEHYNIVMFSPGESDTTIYGPQPADLDHLRQLFRGWDPHLQKLLGIAESSLRWSLLETRELQSWVHPDGKFALLGDAAHACLPFIAHGAAMGIESAVLLSDLLARATPRSRFHEIFKLYNDAQLPRVRTVIARSRLMGEILDMPDGPSQVERDYMLRNDIPKAGYAFAWADPALQSWLWGYDIKAEAEALWMRYLQDHTRD